MRKNVPVGTKVKLVGDFIPGTVVQNRKTLPKMNRLFDYSVRIEFPDGAVEWGYRADELDLA